MNYDETSHWCIYDTVDCYHDCDGCEYGKKTCTICKDTTFWPHHCDCPDLLKILEEKD